MEREETSLEDLADIDFVGGTLVEYSLEKGFASEYARGTITEVFINLKEIRIETDDQASLDSIEHHWSIRKTGGIFYLDTPTMWPYALAPKGVHIPKPGKQGSQY